MSFPRVLGLGFSPLSVFYCYYKNQLKSIIYEVKNTYGDQIEYVSGSQPDPDGRVRHSIKKDMYVSPFIDMAQTYHFTILPPDEKLSIKINENDKESITDFKKLYVHITDYSLISKFPRKTLKCEKNQVYEVV